MTIIKLAQAGFSLIPEGTYVFKVNEIDDSKYEDFGKLAIKMETAEGRKHTEFFTFIRNGKLNEGALKYFSVFARTCLNNWSVEDIDPQDLVGCYIKATVEHETFTKRDGSEGESVKLGKIESATGFETSETDDSDFDFDM